MTQFTEPSLREALTAACAERELPNHDARLLHHYSNAVFVLPSADIVVRLTTSQLISRTITATQKAVARLVHEDGYPATSPIDIAPPVHLGSGFTASFWRYYPQPAPAQPFAPGDLAALVRRLHMTDGFESGLLPWQPLSSLLGELSRDEPLSGLNTKEADWLRHTAREVAHEASRQTWPLGIGLIHGDAWAGNLLWNGSQPILGDWDNIAIGPREVDLIPTWHAAVRYGRDWVSEFIGVYGYDLASSPAFDLLLRMRDLVQLTGPLKRASESTQHRSVLRQRFDAIRSGDQTQKWLAL